VICQALDPQDPSQGVCKIKTHSTTMKIVFCTDGLKAMVDQIAACLVCINSIVVAGGRGRAKTEKV
jgi:hypothetical protein